MTLKKRNPFVASLLSIIFPGLGQIYNGQLTKGVIFFVVGLVISIASIWLGLYFYGFIVIIIFILLLLVFAAADSFITARKLKKIELNKFNQWYIYLIIFIVINIIDLGPDSFFYPKFYSMPSASMANTLLIGDSLIVNKSAYGMSLPFTNKIFIRRGKPQRGDVVVFISPQNSRRITLSG